VVTPARSLLAAGFDSIAHAATVRVAFDDYDRRSGRLYGLELDESDLTPRRWVLTGHITACERDRCNRYFERLVSSIECYDPHGLRRYRQRRRGRLAPSADD
jgi:hypothetical protein